MPDSWQWRTFVNGRESVRSGKVLTVFKEDVDESRCRLLAINAAGPKPFTGSYWLKEESRATGRTMFWMLLWGCRGIAAKNKPTKLRNPQDQLTGPGGKKWKSSNPLEEESVSEQGRRLPTC